MPKLILKMGVPSRREPERIHTVELYEDGNMRCSCMAGEMRKFCHHQKTEGKYLKDLVRKIEKVHNVNLDEIK